MYYLLLKYLKLSFWTSYTILGFSFHSVAAPMEVQNLYNPFYLYGMPFVMKMKTFIIYQTPYYGMNIILLSKILLSYVIRTFFFKTSCYVSTN